MKELNAIVWYAANVLREQTSFLVWNVLYFECIIQYIFQKPLLLHRILMISNWNFLISHEGKT